MPGLHADHDAGRRLDALCQELAERDPRLACLYQTQGTPPLWSRPAGFATLVQIILEQQVSLSSAAAIYRRLQGQLGTVTPETVARGGEDSLRAAGLTRQKTAYCLGLAAAILEGRLDLDALATQPDAEAAAQLIQLKGIGPWTANIYLLMALGRVDIWPGGDLALNAAARHMHGWTTRKTDAGICKHAQARWKPYRSVAARLLWQHYLRGMPALSPSRPPPP